MTPPTGSWFLDHLWLVPLLPALGAFLIALVLRPLFPGKVSSAAAIAAIGASAVVGWGAAFAYFTGHVGETLVPWQAEWLRFSPTLVGNVGVIADDLSMLLVLVVTGVSLLVHVYSLGYMHGDPGYPRFFACLNIFSASMLGLVLAPSILQIYCFWELVGLSSFLLIGYYWEKPSAVAACKKAFIVTRFADLGFLLGLLLLALYGGGLDFANLTAPGTVERLAGEHLLGVSVLTLSAVLVYCGAAGKSAMFPLHIWLPDAMEGPTPVSALIHAATMVVAGVYLVARLFPFYAATEAGMGVVTVIGTFTALFAAVIAVTQFDIKRVLAFSTLSQLGYMMLALGVARMEHPLGYTASLFHLATHACFKAMLFLGAGSVIHAVHSNDMREMGGLRRKMPLTHLTFLVGCLAIAGFPLTSGFFSKDEILAAALHGHHPVVFAVGVVVAGLTAFYMFRLYFMTFWGEARDHHRYEHAHESPASMTGPLLVLAVPSLVLGFVPFGSYVYRGELEHGGVDPAVAIPATLVGLAGIAGAWLLYGRPSTVPQRVAAALGGVYRAIYNKFYVDDLYLFVTHKVIFRYVSRPLAWFDRNLVDGAMDLTAQLSTLVGAWLRRTETGRLQNYLAWMAAGSGVTALALLAIGRPMATAVLWGAVAVLAAVSQLALVLLTGTSAARYKPLKRIERD
jgi:NADH-quinone oxidoreductase subunit L